MISLGASRGMVMGLGMWPKSWHLVICDCRLIPFGKCPTLFQITHILRIDRFAPRGNQFIPRCHNFLFSENFPATIHISQEGYPFQWSTRRLPWSWIGIVCAPTVPIHSFLNLSRTDGIIKTYFSQVAKSLIFLLSTSPNLELFIEINLHYPPTPRIADTARLAAKAKNDEN